jgi:hypothetical protein
MRQKKADMAACLTSRDLIHPAIALWAGQYSEHKGAKILHAKFDVQFLKFMVDSLEEMADVLILERARLCDMKVRGNDTRSVCP